MSANTLDIRVVTDEGKYKGHSSDPETKFQVDFQEEFQLIEPLYSPAQVFGQFSLRNSTLGKQFPGVPEPETQLQLVNKVAVWPLLSLLGQVGGAVPAGQRGGCRKRWRH